MRELYETCRSFGTPTLLLDAKSLVGFDSERWDKQIGELSH